MKTFYPILQEGSLNYPKHPETLNLLFETTVARAPITEVEKIQHNKFKHSAQLKSRLYTFKSYWKVSSLIDVVDNLEGCKFVFRLRPFHFSLCELP